MRVLNLVLTVLFQSVRALGRSRLDLILENLALRQQIAVLTRTKHRPRFRASDRLVWVCLRRSWRRCRRSLLRPAFHAFSPHQPNLFVCDHPAGPPRPLG